MNNEDLIYYPDYAPDADKDDDEMLHIKEAVDKLPYLDKKVFLQFTELGGTYAAFARFYGCSKPTAKKYIEKIKQKIFDNL